MSNISVYSDKEKKMLGLVSLEKEKNPKQSKKNFGRVTFSLNNPVQIDYVKQVLKSEFTDDSPGSKTKYLYILHDKDVDEDGLVKPHLHVIVWGAPRGFVSWANQFSIPNDEENAIPPHMICQVRQPRSMARYLIHKDNPDKHQYLEDEVKGSNLGLSFFKNSLIDYDNLDLYSELKDFQKLRLGEITPFEFLEKYRVYYTKENFSNRMRIYTAAYENYKNLKERLT